jgi:hypothetical protein
MDLEKIKKQRDFAEDLRIQSDTQEEIEFDPAYVKGVEDALNWVLGQKEHKPLDNIVVAENCYIGCIKCAECGDLKHCEGVIQDSYDNWAAAQDKNI